MASTIISQLLCLGYEEQALLNSSKTGRKKAFELCHEGPECRLTRPRALILGSFHATGNANVTAFNVFIGPKTLQRYIDIWKQLIVFFYRQVRQHHWRGGEAGDDDDE